jgi:copper(I)-binding protein
MPVFSFSPRVGFAAAALALATAFPALAGDITVEDPYARAAGASAMAGAAFMSIMNSGSEDDRLIAATSDVARKVELHTHIIGDDGVAKMVHVEEGFVIPAGGMHMLERGADHVMFMGLNRSLANGDMVTVTLTFEKAGDVTIEVPVDNDRKPGTGMGHGQMKHGD